MSMTATAAYQQTGETFGIVPKQPTNPEQILYSLQASGHNITLKHAPLPDYTDKNGPYFEMAQYLGWESWIWAFLDLEDFDNDWMGYPPSRGTVWCVSVSEERIVWCGLQDHCEPSRPVEKWFYPDPKPILDRGGIPMALIQAPLHPFWVRWKCPAGELFKEAFGSL